MLKNNRLLRIALSFLLTMALKSETVSFEPAVNSSPSILGPQFSCIDAKFWGYLRLGISYLESPMPLDPPESVPPAYAHPDLRGFGAYGLSPEAYADVQRLYPFFRDYGWDNMLNSQRVYELANMAFADYLLKNLKDCIPADATQEQIFDVLHRAWNLGLSGFKNGREVVPSRILRAEEFKQSQTLYITT